MRAKTKTGNTGKRAFDKTFFMDIIRSTLIAVIISLVGVLALALAVKFSEIGDNVILPINQVIKILSILFGAIFGIKTKESGALKGLFIGLLYTLVSVFVFLILNKTLSGASFNYVDFATGAAAGLISGIIAVNFKKKK